MLIDGGGSTNSITANNIQHNGAAGVRIVSGTSNPISRNSIFGNVALGIDLDTAGPNAVSHCQAAATGANNLQNAPTLTPGSGSVFISATATDPNGNTSEFSNAVAQTLTGNVVSLLGNFDSKANTTYTIEFFSSPSADASGFGQGQTFVTSTTVTTNGTCTTPINDPVNITQADLSVALTFSEGGAAQQFSTLAVGADFGSQVYTAAITNNGPATAHNVVLTDVLPAGLKVSGMYCNQPSCQSPLTTNLGNCTVSANTVTCNLGTMASGATATVGIPVQALTTGTIANSVSVAATETDPIPANNSASLNVNSQNPFTAGLLVSPTGLLSSAPDTVVTVFGQGYLATSTVTYTDPNNITTPLPVIGFIDNQLCPQGGFSPSTFCAGVQVLMPHALLAAAGTGRFDVTNVGGLFELPVNFTVASACDFGQPFEFDTPVPFEFSNAGTGIIPFIVEVDVNVPSCTLTASSNVPWAVVTGGPASDFPGSYEVDFSVAPNSGPVRTGTLTVAGQTLAITQDAGDATVCTVVTNPLSASLGAAAGNFSIQVTPSNQNCAYFNDSATPFITVANTDGLFVGNGTVHYSVTANPGAPRTGFIIINGGAFTINQDAASTCFFTLSTGTTLFPTNASTGSINVTASLPTCPWTAASDSASFVNITSGGSGTGNGTIQYSLAANTGGPRTVNFTVANAAGASVSTAINQASAAACTFTLSPSSVEISSNGGTSNFLMNASSPSCIGTVTSNNPTSVLTQAISPGQISYVVAANPGTTPRTLTITAGCATFTINQDGAAAANPAPTVTTLSPTSVVAGSGAFTLTVNGTNFINGSTVNFNGTARVTSFVNATQLTAAILASDVTAAGTPAVTVTNPAPGGGTSNSVTFTVTGTNPVPTVTTVAPTTVVAGSGAFTLTVNGTNFISTSTVNINGTARATTFGSATQLTAAILATDITATGTPAITVTNPTPGGGTSNSVTFSVTPPNPVPTIASLSPTGVTVNTGALTLTVNGTNFINTSVVNFAGSPRVTTFVNATQLTAAILSTDVTTVGTPAITVTNPTPGGGTSNSVNFNIGAAPNPAPTVTTLAPTTVVAGSGAFTLTVNGTNFLNTSVVNFGGAARTTTFVNSTQVTAAILAGDVASAGTPAITVTNPAPGGGTSNSVTFTVTAAPNPVPVLTSISPNTASAGSAAFTLIVTGSSFVSTSVVRWNGSSRTTTFVSATQLTAAITAADIQSVIGVNVSVFNPAPGGGTSVNVPFNITTPVPAITTLTPSSAIAGGAAFTLTVTGSNLINTSVVQWNGSNRTTTFVSATQLTAAITAADIATVGTSSVKVFTPTVFAGGILPQGGPAGVFSNALTFTINAANPVPTLTSISPTIIGAGGAAFTLTLNGTNFINGSVAQWKGSARTTTFVSATQLTAAITAADIASSGTAAITVVNPTPGGGTSNSLTFTITDFSVTATTTTQTTTAGQSANFSIATATVGGAFPGSVTFTTTGLPTGANASFNPTSVSAGASTTMTVTTTARGSAQITTPPYLPTITLRPLWLNTYGALIASIMSLALTMTLVFASKRTTNFGRHTTRRLIPIGVFALLLISVGYISGCSGGGFPKVGTNTGTPAGTYTVTVTGTSGAVQHSTTVTLVVQ